jgi:uncharacterized protein (DUF1778 family)
MKTPDTSADKPARKPQLNITLKAEERDLVERVAAKRGLSVSALVRMLTLDEARRLGME